MSEKFSIGLFVPLMLLGVIWVVVGVAVTGDKVDPATAVAVADFRFWIKGAMFGVLLAGFFHFIGEEEKK